MTNRETTAKEEAVEQAFLAKQVGQETAPEQQAVEQAQPLGWAWGNSPGTPIFNVVSSTVSGTYHDSDTFHKLKHLY
jgi:hypothetical protein